MRIDLPAHVIRVLRNKDTPPEVRAAVAGLGKNPYPPDAKPIEGHHGWLQFFESGYWIVYEVKQDRSETVIGVLDIDKN